MSSETEIPLSQSLLFSTQCFASPLWHVVHPEFHPIKAYYSPFADAIYCPPPNSIDDYYLMDLLEGGHKLLARTSIKCLMRYLAGLTYNLEISMIGRDARKHNEDFRRHFQLVHDILDRYFSLVEPLDEAYALFHVIGTLKRSGAPKDQLNFVPEDVEKGCLNNLDAKTGEVYDTLLRLRTRFGEAATLPIYAAQNMPFPKFLLNADEFSDQTDLAQQYMTYLDSDECNPLVRFEDFVALLERFPLVGFSKKLPQETATHVFRHLPRIRDAFLGPCAAQCMCARISNNIEARMRKANNDGGFASPLATSLRVSISLHEQAAEYNSQIDPRELVPFNLKRPHLEHQASRPSVWFFQDECIFNMVTPHIYDLDEVINFESMRQQLATGGPLISPWSLLTVKGDDGKLEATKEYWTTSFKMMRETLGVK